jgi:hypothetical protein
MSRQINLTAPPKNPLPERPKRRDATMLGDGYVCLSEAQPGQPRQPLAEPDYRSGPYSALPYPDR